MPRRELDIPYSSDFRAETKGLPTSQQKLIHARWCGYGEKLQKMEDGGGLKRGVFFPMKKTVADTGG